MNFLSYKKKETSAFYREQIEIYCVFEQGLRRKKINLVNSGWAGGGGTSQLNWQDDQKIPILYSLWCSSFNILAKRAQI